MIQMSCDKHTSHQGFTSSTDIIYSLCKLLFAFWLRSSVVSVRYGGGGSPVGGGNVRDLLFL